MLPTPQSGLTKTMNILKFFNNISIFRGLPTEEKNASSQVFTITGETVQLYYYSGATRTIDAGQAAGVAVEGQLAIRNIKNASGDHQASLQDTSLSFTAGAFTTEVAFPYMDVENGDGGTGAGILAYVASKFTNGQYCVDYSTGKFYGKKNSTAVTLAAVTYKIVVPMTTEATLRAGESQTRDRQLTEEPQTIANITTATTTTPLTGAGVLKKIIINKAVATGVITIYDNTAASGTKLGTITFGAALLTDPPIEWCPDSAIISTGITIVTSQAFDLTVCYDAT